MPDLSNIEQYRKSNRIEVKQALGGLPESLWETYSGFANALGGYILLGVEEYPDRSLHPVDLLDPQWLLDEFWEILADPQKVSVNLLTEDNVYTAKIEGKHIIFIEVSMAPRHMRPGRHCAFRGVFCLHKSRGLTNNTQQSLQGKLQHPRCLPSG